MYSFINVTEITFGQQSLKQVTFVLFRIGGFAPVLVFGAVL